LSGSGGGGGGGGGVSYASFNPCTGANIQGGGGGGGVGIFGSGASGAGAARGCGGGAEVVALQVPLEVLMVKAVAVVYMEAVLDMVVTTAVKVTVAVAHFVLSGPVTLVNSHQPAQAIFN
jgi:hypothetical protein